MWIWEKVLPKVLSAVADTAFLATLCSMLLVLKSQTTTSKSVIANTEC